MNFTRRFCLLGFMVGSIAVVSAPLTGAAAAQNGKLAAADKEYSSSQEEYDARLAAAHGGTKLKWDHLPDWSGVWMRETRKIFNFDESAPNMPDLPMYPALSAQLTPKYLAAYREKIQGIKDGKEWDRLSWCLPAGFPRWLAEPWLREFVVTPNETWMSHEQINETRRILTDGRGHVPEDKALPLWLGDSIGFWDGGTLIVHTTHLKAGQYQRGNPDYSFKTSTVERITLVEPTLIEDRVTVYDPEGLTKPFHAVFHYRKMKGDVRVAYASCEENNNTFLGDDGRPSERLPGDRGYRDADTYGIPEVARDGIPH